MKIKELSRPQRKELEQLPASVLADFLPDLYYWESLGLGEKSVSDLACLVNALIEADRRRKRGGV